MKVKIIEKTHELDLEDEINEFIVKKDPEILAMHYQVAMTFSSELEYSFSCLIEYEDK
ncbi:MAG: sporulation protein Cse60 [Thomasclavelia sp.]|uniref:sporulation protein Cse60 n=1 Tax=Thomasclavelia sp. TaxID=3025757 RepID=UPI0039A15E60